MLKDKTKDAIKDIIAQSFDKYKASLVGPRALHRGFVFALRGHPFNQKISDAYVHSNVFNSMKDSVDKNTIAHLEDTAMNYIDSLKHKTTADILKQVDDHLANAYKQGKLDGQNVDDYLQTPDGRGIMKEIKKTLGVQKEKIDKGLDLIANVSLYDAQNHGAADAIVDMSKSLGIGDPTVFKIGVMDNKRCPICWKLWTLEDRVTPRVYKMSELAGGYMDRKDAKPTVGSSHPRCRDILTFLAPGFGFEGGKITFRGSGWDEYAEQRKKS